MKTYLKTVGRMFKKHIARMLSLFFIVLISVGFVSGIGSSTDKINVSISEYYESRNVSDFIIKTTAPTGFTKEEIQAIEDKYNDDIIMTGTSFDVENEDGKVIRYYYLDFENLDINKIELLDGDYPKDNTEVLVERKTDFLSDYKVGEKIVYNGQEYTVSGIVLNPQHFYTQEEPGFVENKGISSIIYFKSNEYIPITDVYVSFKDKTLFDRFSDPYEEVVKERKESFEEMDNIVVLTLYENLGFYSSINIGNKIREICVVLIIAFVFVSSLVVLSTMTRLLEEERSQIACLETLGYTDGQIVGKYVLFAFVSTIFAGGLGYFLGEWLSGLIYINLNENYTMPVMTKEINIAYYVMTLMIMVVATLIVTYCVGKKTVSEKPAVILLPKAPKSGKKVFLENVPFIWNRLSFKYKSTARNVLRYKKHFFMTVVSITGSTVLVFLGMGVLDFSLTDEKMGPTLSFLATVIVIFAGLLTALVIYTLTNITISERNREIATLMVLGYYDGELSGYIYREILIMSIIGIVFGIPVGAWMLSLIFDALGFGNVKELHLYVWGLTPVVTLVFMSLTMLILRRKIIRIDMNESLKARE